MWNSLNAHFCVQCMIHTPPKILEIVILIDTIFFKYSVAKIYIRTKGNHSMTKIVQSVQFDYSTRVQFDYSICVFSYIF